MELQKVIEQAVEGLGYELVDFETSPRARLLRVFIDCPKGIAIEDCTAVAADYVRFAGQEAQVRLRLAVNGQRNFTGVLAGVADGRLRLECDGVAHVFDLDQVDRARLVPKFSFKEG